MKKIALILCSLMLVICSACSSQQPAAHDLNMTDLAEKLKTSGAFEENISSTMEPIRADRAVDMFGASEEDVKDAVYYTCVGATAAEILIFECTDEQAAQRVYDLAEPHLENLQTTYESYAPEEAKKVENAVKELYGRYVIVVVSSNADIVQSVIAEATA